MTKSEQDTRFFVICILGSPCKTAAEHAVTKSVKAPQKSKYNQVRTMHEATFTCILTPGTQISVSRSSKDMWPSPFWSTFIEAFKRVHAFWFSKNCTTQRKLLYESMNPRDELVKFKRPNLLKSRDLDNNKRHADTITSMNHGLASS